MAKFDDLDARLRKVEQDIAESRGGRQTWLTVLSAVLGVAVVALGYLAKEFVQMEKQVVAMSTLMTQELPKLVLNQVGSDPVQAEKAYRFTDSLIANAAVHKRPLKAEVVNELGEILTRQAQTHDQEPSYWQLASQVIQARSDVDSAGPKTEELPSCLAPAIGDDYVILDREGHAVKAVPNPEQIASFTFHFKNCHLELDDPDFFNTGVGKKLKLEASRNYRGVYANIVLDNGLVTYRGGLVIPIKSLTCNACSVDLNFKEVPPAGLSKAGRQLLTADLHRFIIPVTETPFEGSTNPT